MRVMEVIILCGGMGTRLRDVADHIPKPMVPIGDRPILWHIMKGYAQFDLRRFVLCCGHLSGVIKRYFLDYHLAGSDFTLDLSAPERVRIHAPVPTEDWQVTLAETGLDAQTGCRIWRASKYLTGDRFMVTYGDGVADVDFDKLLDFHLSHGRTATVTAVHPPSRFGEIEVNGRQVVEFNEKPNVSRGRINGGFFVFERRFLDRLNDDRTLVLEKEPLMQLARDGELMAFPHHGFWHPMDTSRDYRYLNDLWESGEAPWKTWDARAEPRDAVLAGTAPLVAATGERPPRKPR
jgi:glucose-1-phosphate cytidylyltransferase